MSRGRRAWAAGFTLLELLVVLLVVAIGSAMVAPAVQSGWESRQIRQATRKVAGVMRGLRERAVRRGVEQELVLEADGTTIRWSEGEVLLPEGAGITGVRGGWPDEDGRVHVVFYPNGGSTGVGLLISGDDDSKVRFAIDLDPMLGTVVIREARERR